MTDSRSWFILATLAITWSASSHSTAAWAAPPHTVRECMWAWSHEAGVYNGNYGLPGNSRITPVEGAHFLGVPNIIFIRYHDRPEPPFQQYAIPFKSLERVVWSITGASGLTSPEERQHVLKLAQDMPNMTGVFMDDFFHLDIGRPLPDGQPLAAMTVAQLSEFRNQIRVAGRPLDLGVTLYTYQLDERILPHLEFCDTVSLWTWRAPELANLETNFAKYEKLVPRSKKKLLGLYMWDFGNRRPMPLESMKMQCERALRWLHEGRIDGMIFLATNICDLKLETVEWARRWIVEHGDEPLQVRQDAGQ